MHSRYRQVLACLAVRSQPPRVCGSGNSNNRHFLATRTRSFSGPSPSTTNNNHRRHFVRTKTTGRSANLHPQTNYGLASAHRDMHLQAEVVAAYDLYDWRTFAPNPQLHYVRTEDAANECVARITSRPGTLTVGLDFEWRPNFVAGRSENPIALIQIACDDEILLVHISAMQGTFRFPAAPTISVSDPIISLPHQASRTVGVPG
jgi:hypothetical protein